MTTSRTLVTLTLCAAISACDANSDDDSLDGSTNIESGGSSSSDGGQPESSAGSGGQSASTGGFTSAEGVTTGASGGSASAAGGTSSAGGGNTSAGGSSASGGGAAGGSREPGVGGKLNSSGGAENTGGSTSEEEPRSAGCDTDRAPESGRFSIDVSGSTREYILSLPDDYNVAHAYPLVFAWHPRGGSADQVATGLGGGYYGLESRSDGSAIFISAEGIDAGWANTDGRDIAFLRAMLDLFRADLCVDDDRLFSTGFSYGGMMSDSIGCEMAEVFRAIAPMAGAVTNPDHQYSGCNQANSHPIAAWIAHGDADTVVPIADGKDALDIFLERNGCDSETTAVDPSPCVAFDGCSDGYPVHWCEFSGGHAIPDFAADAIWDFFSQF